MGRQRRWWRCGRASGCKGHIWEENPVTRKRPRARSLGAFRGAARRTMRREGPMHPCDAAAGGGRGQKKGRGRRLVQLGVPGCTRQLAPSRQRLGEWCGRPTRSKDVLGAPRHISVEQVEARRTEAAWGLCQIPEACVAVARPARWGSAVRAACARDGSQRSLVGHVSSRGAIVGREEEVACAQDAGGDGFVLLSRWCVCTSDAARPPTHHVPRHTGKQNEWIRIPKK